MKNEGISRGIFWVLADTEDELSPALFLMFAKGCDTDGIPVDFIGLNSSDGMSYNHKARGEPCRKRQRTESRLTIIRAAGLKFVTARRQYG